MTKPGFRTTRRNSFQRHWVAIVGIAVATALAVSACSSSSKGPGSKVTTTGANGSPTVVTSSSASQAPKPRTAVPVHVSVNVSDGATVGVGMPYIASFDKKITDGRQLAAATTVTVNDQKVDAAWYCEYSDPASGHVMECHLRTKNYWPANAKIHVGLAIKGKSGGNVPQHPLSQQYVFNDNLTSDFETGDARITTVSNTDHTVTITDNGKLWKQFPTSLGAPDTPTKRGIKVIMEQLPTVCMHDIAGTYYECGIKWDSRLTYDGEYLHSAPWNTYNIDHGINSSNGCTNLHPADAVTVYNFLKVGDPVEYPDATGPRMQFGQGYGDWNVTWGLWQTGGVIPTS